MQSPARDPEIPRLHADYVRRLARSLVFDDALADDVAQDVWVAALEHGPRESSSLRAWLAALVRNFAWKSRRGDRRRSAREEAAARPEAVPSAAEILERESVRRRVIEAVLDLAEPYRSTIVLRYFEDLEPREVSRRLEVPVETVRTREKRAREMLRARLDREHGRDRRAWSLALVRELRLEAPSQAGPITSAIGGGLLMSTVKIVAGAAAAVLLLAGTLAWLETRRPAEAGAGSRGAATADLAPVMAPADRPKAASDRVGLAGPSEGSSPSTQPDLRGSVHVRMRWGDDHSPAADVGLQAEDELGQDDFRWIDARTGPDGTCTMADLRPGKAKIFCDRLVVGQKWWGALPVEIEANRVAEMELEIAPGVAVDGEVVDERGQPVEGATILLAHDQTGWGSRPVAESCSDGTFRIRAAPPTSCLCAYKAGRAPSLRPRLHDSVGSQRHVRLVLPGEGGELEGVVTNSDGAPIADAKVLVGFADYRDTRDVEGEVAYGPASRVASTDEHGHFRIEGLEPGSPALSVRAAGFAQWRGTAEVRAGATAQSDVRLLEQVIVEGSVHDGDGRPLPGTTVALEGPESFLWVIKKTAEDGSFRLCGLPVGDFHLKAFLKNTGTAEVDLHGVAGAVLRWDAVLSSARSITGRVVGPMDGLTGLIVEGQPTKLGRGVLGHVGAEGTFKIIDLGEGSYDLTLFDSKHLPLARALGVNPGTTDVQIQIDRTKLPSARIRGRIVGPENKPVDAEIFVSIGDQHQFMSSTSLHSDPSTGRFEAGPLPPGEWDLMIRANGLVERTIPSRSLATDETWDLGDVELSRGGTLTVTAKLENGSDLPSPDITSRFEIAASGEQLTTVGGAARSGPLLPGHQVLRIDSSLAPPVACTIVPFEITAGQETRLDLVLRAGRQVTIAVPMQPPAPGDLWFTVSMKDGTRLTTRFARDAPSERCECEIRLLDGEYRAEAGTLDGRKFAGTVTVAEGGPELFELEKSL